MNIRLLFQIVFVGMLSAVAAVCQSYSGWLDYANCSSIGGWAWDATQPNTSIQVDLYDGARPIAAAVPANIFRQDLFDQGYGNGMHGFVFNTPAILKDGQYHYIVAKYAGTNYPLSLSNNGFNCLPSSTGYQYYYSDNLRSVDSSKWTQNGAINASASGLIATTTNGGSLISSVPVPDGSGNYEVTATLKLAASGGNYAVYLHAAPNSMSGPAATGTFYSVELLNPTFNGPNCGATLAIYQRTNGTVTQLATTLVPCRSQTSIRAVFVATGAILSYVDQMLYSYVTTTAIASGQPGVGGSQMPAGNSIIRVDLGPRDAGLPTAVARQSIGASVSPNRVDMQWQPSADDPNGTGVVSYQVLRDNVVLSQVRTPEISDATVEASHTYTYAIRPIDYHNNIGAAVTFAVVTPAAGNIDPRQVGVRPTGTYWGAQGEQIDMRS